MEKATGRRKYNYTLLDKKEFKIKKLLRILIRIFASQADTIAQGYEYCVEECTYYRHEEGNHHAVQSRNYA